MDIVEQKTDGNLRFVLSDAQKKIANGRPVMINKRYLFDERGEMVVSAKDAAKLQRILCRYFDCKLLAMEQVPQNVEKMSAPPAKSGNQPSAQK